MFIFCFFGGCVCVLCVCVCVCMIMCYKYTSKVFVCGCMFQGNSRQPFTGENEGVDFRETMNRVEFLIRAFQRNLCDVHSASQCQLYQILPWFNFGRLPCFKRVQIYCVPVQLKSPSFQGSLHQDDCVAHFTTNLCLSVCLFVCLFVSFFLSFYLRLSIYLSIYLCQYFGSISVSP